MPRYHPIAEGLWNDQKLEGAPFEEKAFFCFLCSNTRQRPSGIYRATDEQLSADTELPVKRVRAYLTDLAHRGLIVRDRAWIFVKNYFKRQPKQDRLLIGAKSDVDGCDSILILDAFALQYPTLNKWSTDRQETINRWVHDFVPSEQLQSSNTNTHTVGSQNEPTAFVTLWKNYPEPKGSRQEALKAFRDVCPPENVVELLAVQVAHKSRCDSQGIFWPHLPHCVRWLKHRRWTDEIPTNGNGSVASRDPKATWKSQADYLAAVAAGRVHPKRRIPEWETTPTSSAAAAGTP